MGNCFDLLPDMPTPTTSATNTTQTTTTAGWQLSPTADWSCDQVCCAVGLSCSESEQLAHNNDISSACGIQNIMNKLGKSCYRFSGEFGNISRNIPAIAGGRCFYSSTTRVTLDQYSCIQTNTYRLCYCSGISKSFLIQIVCFTVGVSSLILHSP